jgi:hypothetical protein
MSGNPHIERAEGLMEQFEINRGVLSMNHIIAGLIETQLAIAHELRTANLLALRGQEGGSGDVGMNTKTIIFARLNLDPYGRPKL